MTDIFAQPITLGVIGVLVGMVIGYALALLNGSQI
jgi:ABC-type lipoprotein release transport system permease subunit